MLTTIMAWAAIHAFTFQSNDSGQVIDLKTVNSRHAIPAFIFNELVRKEPSG